MDQNKIGRFICDMRKQRGMTQEQLGETLGVTNKTVSRWETGKYMPDIDKLQELSAVLGISINELLAGEKIADAASFVKKADENIVAVLSNDSSFGLQDRIAYFKSKWLREHKALMLFWERVEHSARKERSSRVDHTLFLLSRLQSMAKDAVLALIPRGGVLSTRSRCKSASGLSMSCR